MMRHLLSSAALVFFSFFFLSRIAFVLRCGIVVVKDFPVMVVNDVAHVRHAAVFQLTIFDAAAIYIYISLLHVTREFYSTKLICRNLYAIFFTCQKSLYSQSE